MSVPVLARQAVPVGDAIAALADGEPVVVTDGSEPHHRGYLVAAAQLATPRIIGFLAGHGSGVISCVLGPEQIARLGIPPMQGGWDSAGSSLHVSVDHRSAGTGASNRDRAAVARALADPHTAPTEIRIPGRMPVLRSHPHGVLGRPAHGEASVDLARLAGCAPAGLICELIDPDGEVASPRSAQAFAVEHGLPLLTTTALIRHRRRHESPLVRVGPARLPTAAADVEIIGYHDPTTSREHVALVRGNLRAAVDPRVWVHRECPLGDTFGVMSCRCQHHLQDALAGLAGVTAGVLVYVRRARGHPLTCAASGGDDPGDDDIAAEILADLSRKRSTLPRAG